MDTLKLFVKIFTITFLLFISMVIVALPAIFAAGYNNPTWLLGLFISFPLAVAIAVLALTKFNP